MKIKNVTIGDKFIDPSNRKSKRISEVVDFIERKSLVTGEIIGYECIAENEFLGQKLRKNVPFSTVVRNKVK